VPQPIRLSKPFYLGAIVGVPLFFMVARIVVGTSPGGPDAEPNPARLLLFVFETLAGVASLSMFLRFWYRAWKAIPSAESSLGPSERLLILFVPVVNVYWPFVAFRPWGKLYNEYLRRYNLPGRPVNDDVFFVFGWFFSMRVLYIYIALILALIFFRGGGITFLPSYIGRVITLITLAFEGFTTYYVCDAVNRLPAVPAEPESGDAGTSAA
jgi:hypothetical protein